MNIKESVQAKRPLNGASEHQHARRIIVTGILLLSACAPLEPQRPPEVRATTTIAAAPTPVPCFTEDERPVLATPTPIDLTFGKATADQYAAALAADDLNEQKFAREVDVLFLKCKATGGTQ